MGLIFVLMVLAASILGQVNADTKVICQGRRAKLTCPLGQELRITSANYGRQDTTTCARRKKMELLQNTCDQDVTDQVKSMCDEHQVCRIIVSNKFFSNNHCMSPRTYIYLTVDYSCQQTDISGYSMLNVYGRDCPGNDLAHFHVKLQKCAAKCEDRVDCVGFVYTTNPKSSAPCWLKSELCDKPKYMAKTAVYKKDPVPVTPDGYAMLSSYGQDCPGEDITSHHVSLQECADKCENLDNCVGFVYSSNPEASAPCRPKHKLCLSPTPLALTAVYHKDFVTPDDYSMFSSFGQDCPGKDITSYDVDLEECAEKCDEIDNCVGFVYTDNPGASAPCWLKHELCTEPTELAMTAVYLKECKQNIRGGAYEGLVAMTKSGKVCQRWDSQQPHQHTRSDVEAFPDNSLLETANFCRNPDGEPEGPWCYTTDPNTRWEYCDISLCDIAPVGYTQYGKERQDCPGNDISWHSLTLGECASKCDEVASCQGILFTFVPIHSNTCWMKTRLCENPVTLNDAIMFEKNDCKHDIKGEDYDRQTAMTKGGKTCQRWDSQEPHKHTRNNVEAFPDNSLQEAANFCRNPDGEPEGPWCYTTDPNTRWEYCDISLCDGSL